jgi:hypothetical protein
LSKEEKIMLIEEKLKSMKDVKIETIAKQSFRGGEIDFKSDAHNKKESKELISQSRRPKALSKAYKFLNPEQSK